jgi:hypothetical protein
LAFAAVATGTIGRARAEEARRIAIDWLKLGDLLRRRVPSDGCGAGCDSGRSNLPGRLTFDRPMSQSPMIEGARLGRLSLVARDWDQARLLMGRASATDAVLSGRSRRMVLLRGRVLEGPISPFVQLGLGQWRVDPDMPAIPHDVLLAGEVGVGIELALTSWASLAIETNCTVFGPERRAWEVETWSTGPTWRPSSFIHPAAFWGNFIAAQASF